MPLLPALRAFFTRLLTDADDALFPQHVFCLTCGALSLPERDLSGLPRCFG